MENKFTILSIDGGGIRGLFPAKLLTLYEAQLKAKGEKNWQVYQNFDLICGTSTGGVIAIALSLGIPAKEIYDMYLENASKIFGNKRSLIRRMWKSAYKQEVLEKIVQEKFQEKYAGKNPILKDCKVPVMIPIYDLSAGKPSVLKSWYHNIFVRDYHIPAYQAAMATSAAPTYFDPYSSVYTNLNCVKESLYNKIDGGVWANNPTLCGILEAQKALGVPLQNMSVLSIGTGEQSFSDAGIRNKTGIIPWLLKQNKTNGPTKKRTQYGILYWIYSNQKKRLIDVFMQGQSQMVQNIIGLMQRGIGQTEKDHFDYLRIDTAFNEKFSIAMDETEPILLKLLAEKATLAYQKNAYELMNKFVRRVENEP